jgi:uncharacterized membrane protein YbhN (UPF0104 family)
VSNSSQQQKSSGKFLSGLFRWMILLLLTAPLGYALYKQWRGVQAVLSTIDWGYFAIGSVIQLIGLPLMGLISWIILFYLNSRQTYLKATGIYFISQLAKYLPGGIWAFPGRAVAYQAVGVDKVASVLSVMREVIALFLGAAIVGLLGLIQGLPFSDWINLTTIAGILICIVLVILTQIPGFWKLIKKIKLFQKINISIFEAKQSHLDFRWLGYTLLVSMVYWLITGVGFYYIAVAVSPNASNLTWLQSSSIFALAWCAGFVIVVAPAGIGVRESALTLLLSQTMPVSEAISVAIIARLWWTVTESLYILIALIWLSGKANRMLLTKFRPNRQTQTTQE